MKTASRLLRLTPGGVPSRTVATTFCGIARADETATRRIVGLIKVQKIMCTYGRSASKALATALTSW